MIIKILSRLWIYFLLFTAVASIVGIIAPQIQVDFQTFIKINAISMLFYLALTGKPQGYGRIRYPLYFVGRTEHYRTN
jgi:hypothetical protein